jgi:D-aminopeptidase
MKKNRFISGIILCVLAVAGTSGYAQPKTAREHGLSPGVMKPGTWNAITDVRGVRVGHVTLRVGDSVRTGVTAILPHTGNIFQDKVPAAIFTGNGFGKLAGVTQVQELGSLESPVILTNTLSVADGIRGVLDHTLAQPGNEKVQSVNAVVGETNDGRLNDIRGRHVKPTHVVEAIRLAASGPVTQGCVGAGTGTVCFGYKGGIGTSSRKLPASLGGYTVGVLVQANFGGVLQIEGVPVGELLGNHYLRDQLKEKEDGSCMIVVATDAPIDARNLQRLAKRAFMGLARTGGIAHHGSGDYVIAFSTDSASRILHQPAGPIRTVPLLHDDHVSPLFLAAIEATEEAILNALFTAETTTGKSGARVESLPVNRVLELLKK